MGLLATYLSDPLGKLAASKLGRGIDHAMAKLPGRPLSDEEFARLTAGLPGPPSVPRWNSSSAPLPDLSLVEAGMRPITGGRRSSF